MFSNEHSEFVAVGPQSATTGALSFADLRLEHSSVVEQVSDPALRDSHGLLSAGDRPTRLVAIGAKIDREAFLNQTRRTRTVGSKL